MTMKGLKGEVFVHDERIAGAIPPLGQPDAIPFEITCEHPPTHQFPAWADVRAGNVLVRINPDICEPPWFRLFDCLMFAVEHALTIHALGRDERFEVEFDGTMFLFWQERLAGRNVVMIDTLDRVTQWHA